MGNDIQVLDMPKGLVLTPIEQQILHMLCAGNRVQEISRVLGIPISSINNLVRKKDVKDFLQEMVDARNLTIKMQLPNLLMSIIDDKITKVLNNPEATIGDVSKKDIVDIIKELKDVIKVSDSPQVSAHDDDWTKIYQQVNIVQGK